MLYCHRLESLIFGSARRSPIEANRSELGSAFPVGKADEEDRLGEVVASQKSNFQADGSIKQPLRVHLILREGNKILLLQCDGVWGLLTGHVESDESEIEAVTRESKDQVGIEIDPSELEKVFVKSTDLFFECRSWRGLVENLQPSVCSSLGFFLESGVLPIPPL